MTLLLNRNITGKVGEPFAAQGGLTALNSNAVITDSPFGFGVRAPVGSATGVAFSFTATNSSLYADVMFKVSKSPGAQITVLQYRTTSDGAAFGVRVNADGTITVHSGSASVGTSTVAIPWDSWLRMSTYLNAAGTNFSVKVFPSVTSTTPLLTVAGTVPSTMVSAVRFAATPSSAAAVDYAWPQLDNSIEPGPRQYVGVNLDHVAAIVPYRVTATATTLNIPVGGLFTFRWGDGSVSGPQESMTASHEYVAPGEYDVTVEVT